LDFSAVLVERQIMAAAVVIIANSGRFWKTSSGEDARLRVSGDYPAGFTSITAGACVSLQGLVGPSQPTEQPPRLNGSMMIPITWDT